MLDAGLTSTQITRRRGLCDLFELGGNGGNSCCCDVTIILGLRNNTIIRLEDHAERAERRAQGKKLRDYAERRCALMSKGSHAMSVLDSPFVVIAIALIVQLLAVHGGRLLCQKSRFPSEEERKEFDVVQAATLTLLGLILGFSVSMAVTRYDQRKNYEEAEANAIGTEYVRADLLPAEDAPRAPELLKKYLDLRIAFYLARDSRSLGQINDDTAKLQAELWSSILRGAKGQPTPVTALAVSGMNDVLNSQGHTQAAWWNRIPIAAWAMMGLIAVAPI